ncbi:uncharacterized protein DC041_0010608 [Schistosoma bovis]|uniref:Uncharacterized protein n=1 Tax=Schistosoma bovis TaxID=6184 RepID=A0A430QR59_SCHBO|nr:uncharacterized protein DC041_0010608 [Schistosoma bovis]
MLDMNSYVSYDIIIFRSKVEKCLVPGYSITCRLIFFPDKPSYYEDCIRVHTEKCLVPGYSITCRLIFFPDKPSYYEDCIRVHTEDHENQLVVPIYAYPVIGDFEFPEFIEFPPTNIGKNYSTCELKFELHIAQVNFQPKCCTVIGNALPGLERLESTPKYEITCPHHLVKFLLGSQEKLISSQRNNTTTEGLTRQQKLLTFESMVHQNLIDEQRNQVRWQSKLGANPLSPEERVKILDSRELAWKQYYVN